MCVIPALPQCFSLACRYSCLLGHHLPHCALQCDLPYLQVLSESMGFSEHHGDHISLESAVSIHPADKAPLLRFGAAQGLNLDNNDEVGWL